MKQTKTSPDTKTKAPALETIEEKTWKGRQTAHYQLIAKLGAFKIKVSIERDSYDFQSSASIWIWNEKELKWSVINTIPYPQMASLKTVNYYSNAPITPMNFAADKDSLIKTARQIIF